MDMDWIEPLLIGARYLVTIDDCCVQARFTAVLTEMTGNGQLMKFDNGVRLEGGFAVTMEEVR